MEMHEIRYFLALCETLNFTRAAELANVTQPALTRAIKHLEAKLGGPLIHRERGNTHLTELGQMMRPYFSEMLGNMAEAKRRALDFTKLKDATLRLGLMCTVGPTKFIDLFGAFHDRHSGVQLYIKDGPACLLEQSLTAGELDLAIYSTPVAPPDLLHMLTLYSERFMVACAPSHRLARLATVRMQDLEGESYLSRVNCEYRDVIREIREEMGVDIHYSYSSERDDWVQCMVLAGLGFTLIPEFSITVPGLAVRPLIEPEIVRTINVSTVRGRPHSPAVGAFVHELKRYPWPEKLRKSVSAIGQAGETSNAA
jgi:DNA-binding transcriptional LysR family regulator